MNRTKFAVLGCVGVITFFWLGIYGVGKQVRRRDVNQPLIAMLNTAKEELSKGAEITSVIPKNKVKMETELEPFMIIFNERGEIATGSVELEGKTPKLPISILEVTKDKGINKITWQPKQGIRSAVVIIPYPHGWILAGRSLRIVEADEIKWLELITILWVACEMIGILVVKKMTSKIGYT